MNAIYYIDTTKTGQKINSLRLKAGLSVKDIQKIFGFETPSAIYKWLNGASMPTIDNMINLAKIFGVKIDDIIVIGEYKSA